MLYNIVYDCIYSSWLNVQKNKLLLLLTLAFGVGVFCVALIFNNLAPTVVCVCSPEQAKQNKEETTASLILQICVLTLSSGLLWRVLPKQEVPFNCKGTELIHFYARIFQNVRCVSLREGAVILK